MAVAIATQLPTVGAWQTIDDCNGNDCSNWAALSKIQDKGSGSKIKIFN
jgi:hypothetical protein